MSWFAWLLLVAGVAIGGVWLSVLLSMWSEKKWIPPELRHGRLVYSEKPFSIQRPVRLSVRVDRAYQVGDHIQLVELKVRDGHRLFMSDVIEMSAQRLVVEKTTGMKVSDFGIFLLQRPAGGRRTVKKVWLLDQRTVLGLALRREEILRGSVLPTHASSIGTCRSCLYQRECNGTFKI
ncbi:hypothetical protein GJ700_02510 [Duganella sp. FT92W]|uniref:PD-(D/E)XK endonuclease-like domain-containing protein n=1 Tax=Pseudoduganella rivuli TaxID=2666085 RepID=A0A7X2LQW8_9BURK|nr:hypothetical protein [Pseudoduganella rivuli]MRV70591.1 hypothetical protein [Pseudoduganella rivuli]